VPNRDDPNVRYFGAGVHRAGKICVGSNQTVYIAPGAVVYGAIEARGASNVRILGRGILDTSGFQRVLFNPARPATDVPGGRLDTNGFDHDQVGGCLHLTDCRNVVVEGIILRDPNEWCCALFGCAQVDISNIKLIGLWRYNADGIDVCNGCDVTIRDSFIRSYDDCLIVKGLGGHRDVPARNILVERCVVWCDWGRAFHVGLETCAPEMCDLIFRDSDLIRASHLAMDIQHGDRAAIHDVLFENIRVEMDDAYLSLQLQKSPEDKYQYLPNDPFVPALMGIEIMESFYNVDPVRGTVANVTFRNISVTGKLFPRSQLTGWDAAHGVKGVVIENLRFNGRTMRTLPEAGVEIGQCVQDVRVCP